jgi:ATPase subunit of ABC transporter with duplicated ATPase domains
VSQRPSAAYSASLAAAASVRQLVQALEDARGAILVARHDVPFLRSAGISRWLRLDRHVGLKEIDPL